MTNRKNLEQTSIFDLFQIEEEEVTTVSVTDLTMVDPIDSTKEEDRTIAEDNKKQEEALSLFEDEKKEETAQTKSPNASNKSSKKEAGDKFNMNPDTIISYAGQTIAVTQYFTTEEITNGIECKQKGELVKVKIQEKDVVKKLNQDFAELMPQLTSLAYFEKQNIIVPVLQARKKGLENTVEMESSLEGSFSSPKRIPFSLLTDFVSIAKVYSTKYQTELHADIYYDCEQDAFFMDFPKQVVHSVWVERTEQATETALKFMGRSYRKVMEIHSHHRMAPLPSSTDNKNERAPILYAIVGHIENYFPSMTVRTFNPKTQKHIPLRLEQVFECPFSKIHSSYNLTGVEVDSHE